MRILSVMLAVVLMLGAIACNRQAGEAAAKPDAELYSYIPSDATFIAGARLSRMRSSPVYARFRDRLPAEAQPYEKEAIEMVMASNGTSSVVLVRGKFDKQRVNRDAAGAPKGTDIAFLRDDLIAIARPAEVESARRRTGSPLTKQIPASAHIWAITNGGLPIDLPERSNLANLGRLSQDLKLATLALQVSGAIQAELHAEFIAEQSGEQMQTALRGFIGLARLSTPDNQPQYLQALDAIQIKRDKSKVTLTADWPPAMVDTVLKSIPER